MAFRRNPGLLLVVALVCAGVAAAQQPAPAARLMAPTARPAAARTIDLSVVVTPKSGAPVAGLQQQDFTVLDNNVRQPIVSFRERGGKDPGTEVILLVDAVNISFEGVAYERNEIEKFLRGKDAHLDRPTALAVLTDKGVELQEGFTADGNALAHSLDQYNSSLRTIDRATGFYGATERFQISIDALRTLIAHEAPRPGRKIVIWISPGWPLLSGPGIQLSSTQENAIFADIVSLSAQMREARITLDALDPAGVDESVARTFYYESFLKGVTKPGQADMGDLSLQVLAAHSGGLVLNSNGIAELLQKCVADSNAYYELSFHPQVAERPSEYHRIEVKVAKPGLTARTIDGYYSQP